MKGGVSAEQRAMVGDWQQSTMDAAKAGMAGTFEETLGSIANQMADRGLTDSSAYGAATGLAQRDLQRQYGSMAAQTQAQAAQQLMAFSNQNQNIGMSFLQQREAAKQAAMNPQLLRDLMDYRLRTGIQSGTSSGWGSTTGLSTSTGSSTSSSFGKEKTGTDWASLAAGVLGAYASRP
jgi:hypothetical protein